MGARLGGPGLERPERDATLAERRAVLLARVALGSVSEIQRRGGADNSGLRLDHDGRRRGDGPTRADGRVGSAARQTQRLPPREPRGAVVQRARPQRPRRGTLVAVPLDVWTPPTQ